MISRKKKIYTRKTLMFKLNPYSSLSISVLCYINYSLIISLKSRVNIYTYIQIILWLIIDSDVSTPNKSSTAPLTYIFNP